MRAARSTQCSRLLSLLKSRQGLWVPLPDILALGFSQFGARLLEIRRDGHTILNKTEHRDGKVLSWYKLVPNQNSAKTVVESGDHHIGATGSLFGDISPDRTYAE